MGSDVISSSLDCSYSSDGGTTYISAVGCTHQESSQTITIVYTLANQIAAGTEMMYRVVGVNSPPTQTTITDITYKVETADVNGVTIDSRTSCSIEDVCVTNRSGGVFTNTTQVVNAEYGNPELTFSGTPTYVTMQQSDTIRVYFSPFSSLATCT